MLGTQNSKEIRLPDAHMHLVPKAVVGVSVVAVECAIGLQSLGAPGRFLRVKELGLDV